MSDKNQQNNGPKLDRAAFPLLQAFTELAGRKLKELGRDENTFKEIWTAIGLTDEVKLTLESGKPCFFTVENVVPDYKYERRSIKIDNRDVIHALDECKVPMIPGNWEQVLEPDQEEVTPLKLDLGNTKQWEGQAKFLAGQMVKLIPVLCGQEIQLKPNQDWLNRVKEPQVANRINTGSLILGHMFSFVRRIEGGSHRVIVHITPITMSLDTGVT